MLALKPWLQQKGLSQAWLARALQLHPSTVAQWLNKEIWPATPAADALQESVAKALKARGYAALYNPT